MNNESFRSSKFWILLEFFNVSCHTLYFIPKNSIELSAGLGHGCLISTVHPVHPSASELVAGIAGMYLAGCVVKALWSALIAGEKQKSVLSSVNLKSNTFELFIFLIIQKKSIIWLLQIEALLQEIYLTMWKLQHYSMGSVPTKITEGKLSCWLTLTTVVFLQFLVV